MAGKHPENLKDLNEIKVTPNVEEFAKDLAQEIEEAEAARAGWKAKDEALEKQRFGIRDERVSPWVGASNASLPLIDSDIRAMKPHYVNINLRSTPIIKYIGFGPEDQTAAKKRERLRDWQIRTKMDFFKPYVIGVDKVLQSSAVVFKTIWNYATRKYTEVIDLNDLDEEFIDAIFDDESLMAIAEQRQLDAETPEDVLFTIFLEEFSPDLEFEENEEAIRGAIEKIRAGEERVEVNLIEREHDEAQLIACDLRKDVVIPTDTQDIQKARFIDYPYWQTKNDIKISIRDGKFRKFDDQQIEEWVSDASKIDTNLNERTNISQITENSELILLHETCVWYDIDNDGILERCIMTWPDNDPTAVLRFIELPYDHGRWPYAVVSRELLGYSIYENRGIPELANDFQVGVTDQFNMMVNNSTILNNPPLVYNRDLLTNHRNLKYNPGGPIETKDIDRAFKFLQVPNIDQGNFLETMKVLKSWDQERLGNISFGFASPNNEGGKRTATEAQKMAQVFDVNVSLDLQVFQDQMKEVFYQIDALWEQFGPEEEEIAITGQEPERISRRETQGRFNIVPNGRIDNTSPQVRAIIADNLLRTYVNDPDIKQGELKQLHLEMIDISYAERLLKTDQEKLQEQQILMNQQEQAKLNAVLEQVEMTRIGNELEMEKETAQARLDVLKARLLEPIEGKKYAPN